MAKKINKEKKLKKLKEERNANLILSGLMGGYGAIKGHGLAKEGSIKNQNNEVFDRINGVVEKARRGEKLTELEAKLMQGPSETYKKIYYDILPKTPRTKKAGIKGALAGGALMGLPNLVAAGINQHKINKLKKQIKKDEEKEEKKFSIMSKMFSKKNDKEKDDFNHTTEDLSKMSHNQILRLLDKRAKRVDEDKKEYIEKKTRRGGIVGSIMGGLGTAAAVGLGSKYLGSSNKEALIRAALSGLGVAGYGYKKGREVAKENAEDYVKTADEFNKEKVTKKYAKSLDKKMRDLGRIDDLEAVNAERYRNEKKAKREYEDYLKHNSVLNLGRNSIRIR